MECAKNNDNNYYYNNNNNNSGGNCNESGEGRDREAAAARE